MAKGPLCPKCGGEEFDYSTISRAVPYEIVCIVYCKKCGHIIGCCGSFGVKRA